MRDETYQAAHAVIQRAIDDAVALIAEDGGVARVLKMMAFGLGGVRVGIEDAPVES